MSTAPPVVLARSGKRPATNGVLPMPASATQRAPSKATGGRPLAPRLKVIVRRLPPELTEAELREVLGPEWAVGGGWVDWMVFKAGKTSADPAKLSRPARAYLHVTEPKHLVALSDKIRQSTIHDAKGTWNASSLLGPPSVEFAPYGRMASGKRRVDGRQGTITHDPDFLAFLDELAHPPASRRKLDDEKKEGGGEKEKKETVVTPLVEFLKAKKAAARGKKAVGLVGNSTRAESGGGGPGGGGGGSGSGSGVRKTILDRASGETSTTWTSSPGKVLAGAKIELATRDGKKPRETKDVTTPSPAAVRSTRDRAPTDPTTTSSAHPAAPSSTPPPPPRGPAADRRRERGSGSVAARIAQRDLGLSLGGGESGARRRRPGTENAAGASSGSSSGKPAEGAPTENATPPTIPIPSSSSNPGRSTATVAKAASASPSTGNPPSAITKATKPPPTPLPVSAPAPTQAFLKHANASQGITQAAVRQAMEVFGPVLHVEMDHRKGFAYVHFAVPAGLQNAIRASPVEIAAGQVVVLERRDRGGAKRGGGGGGASGGRGGGGGGGESGGAAAGAGTARGAPSDRARAGASSGGGRGSARGAAGTGPGTVTGARRGRGGRGGRASSAPRGGGDGGGGAGAGGAGGAGGSGGSGGPDNDSAPAPTAAPTPSPAPAPAPAAGPGAGPGPVQGNGGAGASA